MSVTFVTILIEIYMVCVWLLTVSVNEISGNLA